MTLILKYKITNDDIMFDAWLRKATVFQVLLKYIFNYRKAISKKAVYGIIAVITEFKRIFHYRNAEILILNDISHFVSCNKYKNKKLFIKNKDIATLKQISTFLSDSSTFVIFSEIILMLVNKRNLIIR